MSDRQARALRRAVRQEAKELMAPRALADVALERQRQDECFPDQHLPFGTGPSHVNPEMVDAIKLATNKASEEGKLTWRHILAEEVMEAMAESGLPALREELIQVAAVAVRIVEEIDLSMSTGRWYEGYSGPVILPAEPVAA